MKIRSQQAFLSGLAISFGTQGYNLILPDSMRLGLLVLGISLMSAGAYVRAGAATNRTLLTIMTSIVLFLFLVIIQVAREHDTLSGFNLIFQLIALVFFLVGIFAGVEADKPVGNLPNALVYFLSVFVGVGFFMLATNINEIGQGEITRGFEDDDLNAVGVAYTAAIQFLVFGFIYLTKKGLAARLACLAILVLSSAVMVRTASRGAPIFVFLTLVAMLFPVLRNRKLVRLRLLSVRGGLFSKALIFLVGAATLFAAFSFAMRSQTFVEYFEISKERFASATSYVFSGSDRSSYRGGDASVEERISIQDYYIDRIAEQPLLGIYQYGLQGFSYPHNLFLEWLARFGIVGFLVTSMLLITIIKSYSIYYRASDEFDTEAERILMLAVFLFAFMQSMTSMTIEMNRALLLCFGYFLSANRAWSSYIVRRVMPAR